MRRTRAFTLVEIMIVVLIIGILMMIAVPHWRAVREQTTIRGCAANRERIEKFKQQWITDQNLDLTASPAEGDLAPTYLKRFPECPSGGTYTIGNGTTHASCSVHGSP